MRRFTVLAAGVALSLAGCDKPPAGGALPSDALDSAIAARIGDPTTCVLLADAATGKVVYTYGAQFNCTRSLPACDRPGSLSAQAALPLADTPDGRHASCNSLADGSRTVGWAQGRVTSAKRRLIYSAVMEGQRTLPGVEMAARLDNVFKDIDL